MFSAKKVFSPLKTIVISNNFCKNIFGIGIDSNVNVASVLGVLNAINRAEA